MFEAVTGVFDSAGFPPRWQCGNWSPALGWLHILSDLGIWSAYFAIPLTLGFLVARRRFIPFRHLLVLFALFIVSCGTTHLLEAVIFWWPGYRLAGAVKLLTAVVSWVTVIALVRNAPTALAMRTPAELEREIADRERAEAALRESQTRFDLFMDANPSVAWMKDADGRYVYLSRSYQRQVGADEGWIGKTDFDVWPEAEARQFQANDRRVLECGAAEQMTETAAHPDGTTRTWLSVKFPFTDAAGRRYVGGLGIDLTDKLRAEEDRRRAEEAQRAEEERRKHERRMLHAQKLESLGVLAGGIAHDFNNLLTGILGYASLARLDLQLAGHPAVAHLEHIEMGALRAADLCKQMLAYAGKGQVAVQPTDLNRLVQEMTQLLGMSISKKAVLRYDLANDPPAVRCDATQMRQVVMNLITNASDAVGDRSGLITIATGVIDADARYLTDVGAGDLPPKRYVTLEVSDNGSGMSEETKARIFEPFFTTKFTGRGLGLSAVAGIVRSHRGAIKVYSQEGKGTMFKVLLPATDATAPPDPARSTVRAAFGRGRAALVVDDEEPVRVLIRKVLTAAGFEVELAADGRAGVAEFAARPAHFAVALVDLTMPHLGGADVFRELRALRKDVSVVLMSGFAESDATAGFAGKGLAGFLRKPFSVPDLLAAVHAAVGGE